jgi:serine/threonine-protein kinase RsbT
MHGESERAIVFRLPIREDSDVAQLRFRIRSLCAQHGFATSAVEALATAASEVARNSIVHAHDGEVLVGTVRDEQRTGVVVVVRDAGPGIGDIDEALRDGYSTGEGLGLGLPSARRLVHQFELRSAVGAGTTVTLTMWVG